MYSVTLTRIVSNHDNLRDGIIEGFIFEIPQEGQQLLFIAPARDLPAVIKVDGRDQGTFRRILTSEIQEVKVISESCLFVKTRNSCYKLSNITELPNETATITKDNTH